MPILSLYRAAFGGLPTLTWLLCAAAFLNRCGSMVVPFLGPYLKKQFQFTPTEAGLVIGLYGVGAFLGSWLGGVLFDTTGSYALIWWISIALGVIALFANLPIREHPAAPAAQRA